jgi:predicted phage terminase large subunit-like protein
VAAKFPEATAHYVEDTANGPAIISSLRHEVSGVIAVKPEGDKYSRAQAAAPVLEAGNVYLPKGASWVDEFIAECTRFPNGRYDDRVDALSQAINRMRKQFVW